MTLIDKSLFRETADWISTWRRPVLVSHTKPDGDALGSLLAMRSLLATRDVSATALLFEPIPDRYAWLSRGGPLRIEGDKEKATAILDRADGVIILDTCSYSQLEPIAEWLRRSHTPKLAVDHHATRDELADRYLCDSSASATCLILYDWARAVDWPVESSTAAAIFVGISTDTGWFRHSNTDARTLAACAELVSLGVRAYELFESIYQQDPPGRLRLLAQALQTLEFHADGRIALMTLSREAFRRAAANPSDTEDIVNEPLRMATVAASILLVEQDDGQIRINLRSKPAGSTGRPELDVSSVSRSLGGGGHRHAAGARVRATLTAAREQVLSHLLAALPS